MKKFHCSYSVLEPLSRGDVDEAVKRYLRIEIEPTEAMLEGRILHEQWRAETERTGCLPAVFGGDKLEHPQCEFRLTAMLDGWIEFTGILDCLELSRFHDYKSGRAGVKKYASSMQFPCYQWLLKANGLSVDVAMIHFWNQHIKKEEHGKIYLGSQSEESGAEWIRTWASELHQAIEEYERHNEI